MNQSGPEKVLTLAAPAVLGVLLASAYVFALILLFFEDWSQLIADLDPHRYPFRGIAFGIAVFGGPFLCLYILFTKTVLTENEIIHRTLFYRTTRRPYCDVVNVEITRRYDVLISFRDGSKIKANTGESRLAETMRFLKERIN